ncbi:uncharacterized protein EAF02_001009 [Botrytis sinoallii]|uniref:uncharacterized protein n=1 Tax=Botrytis sinoallii TaxID=1463999 RepID=UPI001901D307|nr:uncharacterized protein EAF02_001009 [Botrytis sinoallii]KAF7893471.1 hypothetical protein EAF02_001009 [Botrytis sinoallii]
MPLKANASEKSDDEKLLIAVLSLWNPLPSVDNNKLGALLGIKPGTAAVRWHRFKAKLLKGSENNKSGDDMKAAAVFDNKKRGKNGGRKRAAVTEGPNEPPAQRKKIDKSIGNSLNASTSKPGLGKGRKTNKDKEPLEGLSAVKQENGQFEIGIQWQETGDGGNMLDELFSVQEA